MTTMLFGDTPPEELGQHLGFLLNLVGSRSREQFAAQLAELGLRVPHFGLLLVLDNRPGVAQQELVSFTRIDASTMVAMIDELEEQGMAERRPHPNDRRKRAVYLTPKGKKTLKATKDIAEATRQTIFGALDDAEQAELKRLLRKLAGYAD